MPAKQNIHLRFDGLKELKAALKALPDRLKEEAGNYVVRHAQAAAGAIRRNYPKITGNLQDGVHVVVTDAGKFGVRAVVENRAKHAYIYEYGTEARHYYTTSGTRKSVGRMPAGRVFVPAMIDERRRFMDDLTQLILRNGMEVRERAA